MANTQYAFLTKTNIPSLEQWQEVIDGDGFDFLLDPTLKPFEDSGFLPCKLGGKDSGFEIYYENSAEMLKFIDAIAPGNDYCIAFRWGGRMDECASTMIASYALAKHFGAIVSYEGDTPYSDLDVFLKDTNNIIEDAWS